MARYDRVQLYRRHSTDVTNLTAWGNLTLLDYEWSFSNAKFNPFYSTNQKINQLTMIRFTILYSLLKFWFHEHVEKKKPLCYLDQSFNDDPER